MSLRICSHGAFADDAVFVARDVVLNSVRSNHFSFVCMPSQAEEAGDVVGG